MATKAKVEKVIRAFIIDRQPQVGPALSVTFDPRKAKASGRLTCRVSGGRANVKVIIFTFPSDPHFRETLERASKYAAEVWAGTSLASEIRHQRREEVLT